MGPQDEIYILGDLTMKGAAYAEGILWQLNGRKLLSVRGMRILAQSFLEIFQNKLQK